MSFNSVQSELGKAGHPERRRGERTILPVVEGLAAAAFRVGMADLHSRGRGCASVAFARQVAMYLAHVALGLSLAEVGAHFGRDRTTVAHACARVEDRRDEAVVERILSCLEAALGRWREAFAEGAAP